MTKLITVLGQDVLIKKDSSGWFCRYGKMATTKPTIKEIEADILKEINKNGIDTTPPPHVLKPMPKYFLTSLNN